MSVADRKRFVPGETFKVTEIAEDELPDTKETRLDRAAKDALAQIKRGKLKIPMLPASATEAMALANDPASSMQALVKVIGPDPLLSAKVLTIANSPLYSRGQSITSLRSALMLLGTTALRDVLYQAVAEAFIFRGDRGDALQHQRVHALGVAHICRMVCSAIRIDGEYALICGLLHDLGRIVLMGMLRRTPVDGLDDRDVDRLITKLHTQVGGYVATTWNLPHLVVEATQRHHIYRGFAGPGSYSQIGNLVAVAENLAYHHGLGDHTQPLPPEGHPSLFDLGLAPDQIDQLMLQTASLKVQ